jgi:glycosyltransferase involved in cell wall biosynthesis
MKIEVPIIIPAYEPDERLITLLSILVQHNIKPIILVNDGSDPSYNGIFNKAGEILQQNGSGTVLNHKVNKGKGRALKTAFRYVLDTFPNAIGVVTADSDGQHDINCIISVADTLKKYPDSLILGVRNFDGEGIPWKSRFGNKLTEKIFAYVAGVHVTDTQTGLRGIPRAFMNQLLDTPGERFEFETQMLLECAGHYEIREIEIKTIYDSKESHQTHFNPLSDSIKIYRILAKRFIKYMFASLSSCVVDLILFAIFCGIFRTVIPDFYVAFSTVSARIISATYNYLMNYKIVFRSKGHIGKVGIRYFILAVIQMTLSAALVTGGVHILPFIPEVVVKAIVDTLLFFISYHIQQKYIF